MGVEITMLRPIYDFVRERGGHPGQGFAATIFELLESRGLAEIPLRPDGTTIRTDWSDVMSNQDLA